MSEIKTIKGKCEFLCVPAFEIEFLGKPCHRCPVSVEEATEIGNLREKNKWSYLKEITEEDARLLVDYAECRINGIRIFYNYGNKTTSLPTAKESLFSLLKANDCWIKDWFYSTTVAHDTDEAFKWQQAPDDYLLIIKK